MKEQLMAQQPSEQPAEGGCRPPRTREVVWDNYKGMLMLIVVFYETWFIPLIASGPTSASMWDSVAGRIFLVLPMCQIGFCMPGFFFVSGYMSKASMSKKDAVSTLKLFVTWLINHTLWLLIGGAPQEPGPSTWNIFGVGTTDWFLWCLVVWRLVLPVLAHLRWPVTTSFAVSMFLFQTDVFKNTYTFAPVAYGPFVMAGFVAQSKRAELDALRQNTFARAAAATIMAAFMLSVWLSGQAGYRWLAHGFYCMYGGVASFFPGEEVFRSLTLQNLADSMTGDLQGFCQTPRGVAHVVSYYCTASILVLSGILLTPSSEVRVLTSAGRQTLYIYLMQPFVTMFPPYMVLFSLSKPWFGPWLACLIWVGWGFGYWALFSRPWVKRAFGCCIEPQVEACCVLP